MPACTTPACDAVGLLVTLAQLGQFLPQHYEMMVDESVVGVSPYLLFFNSLYTYFAALDIILTDFPERAACHASAYRCFIDAQPVLQMVGSAALCSAMWYWFLKYHHHTDQADPEERKLFDNVFYTDAAGPFFNAFVLAAAGFTIIAAGLVCEFGFQSHVVRSFAYFCGILSAVLNGLMWIPQIFVTAAYGHKGALSLGWVFLSVVMDVTFSVYLAAMGKHWSVWANNVPDGIQTSILLVMLLRLEYTDTHRRRNSIDETLPLREEDRALERVPL